MMSELSAEWTRLAQLWEEHMRHEFQTCSTEDTLATMVEDAYVNHVPVMTGGVGHAELRQFYATHFIPMESPEIVALRAKLWQDIREESARAMSDA